MTPNIVHLAVGETRTGKTIICATEFENAAVICRHLTKILFSIDDLLDALAVFEYLSVRAVKKGDLFADIYENHLFEIGRLIPQEDFDAAKFRAGIITAFDLRNLGQSLVRIEFKDS